MQIRPRAYLQFISLWRSARAKRPPYHDTASRETSPSLIYAATVLAFLLAILEIDRHQGELEALGLLGRECPIQAVFLSP